MAEIRFKGTALFKFKDNNAIQIMGTNEYKKRLIIDIFLKVLNGYKFSDIEMEAMDGFYPEIIIKETMLKKNDVFVIRISSIRDIFEQLQVKKNSIIFKYLLSLNNKLSISQGISDIEDELIKLSIRLDKIIESKIKTDKISIKTDIVNINFKRLISSFIDINFIDQLSERKPLWILDESQIIDLFLNIIELTINNNDNVTIIVDGLDIRLDQNSYKYFIDKIYTLTKKYSNFKIWLIPTSPKGVFLDYNIFNNTYVINKEITAIGDFDTTYDSICRNYPDNNIPTKEEVLKSILQLFPFHTENKIYKLSKEVVVLQLFLRLLGEDFIVIDNTVLSKLETNFLTSDN